MIDLKKYYEFFSQNSFSSESEIFFFNDGSFAIKNQGIFVYDENCELVGTYKTNALLCKKTGVVVVVEDGVGFDAYYKGKKITSTRSGIIRFALCYPHGYGFYFSDQTSPLITSVYTITVDGEVMISHIPGSYRNNGCRFSTDKNGYTIRSEKEHSRTLFCSFFERTELNDVIDVRFLRNNRAIIVTKNGSDLIEYKGPASFKEPYSLLHSDNKGGIRAMRGDFSVIFEDALVADAETGIFISEFKNELFVSSNNIKVREYVIEYPDLKTFWPGRNFQIFEVEDNILFVTHYNGKFYPFFLELEFDEKNVLIPDIDIAYSSKLFQMAKPG